MFFPYYNLKFSHLYIDENYDNGDPLNINEMPLNKIKNNLDSLGLPAQLNTNRTVI